MALESATYISGLNSLYPETGDSKTEGDDHLRLIKSTLLATFPNITGAVTPTHTEINESASFLQAGVDAVSRSGRSKMRDVINALDFGVDPTGVADSLAGLAAAITRAAVNDGDVILPPGTLKISGAITVPAGVSIIGAESKTILTPQTGTYTLFTISGSDVSIKNLRINNAAKTGGYDFLIACGTSTIERTLIENVLTYNSFGFLTDSGSSGYHITTNVRMCQARSHNGPGISFTRSFAFLFVERTVIDFVGVSTSNYTAFYLDGSGLGAGSGGCIFTDCDVLGTSGTHTNANQVGFNFSSTAEVWLIRTTADTCDGKGYVFSDVNKLHMVNVHAGLCNNHGIEMTDVANSDGVGVKVYGRVGVGSPAANIDGIKFVSGCETIVLSNILVRDCTGHGINKAGAQTSAINISNLMAVSNTGRGVKSTGDSAFLVTGATLLGNTAGNYDLGGAFDFLHVSQLNSGSVVSVGPGPVSA